MLINKKKAFQLIKLLNKSIKNPKTSLKYRNKFTLLTSVVLSAQCTDTNVNNVTKIIYKKYYTPKHFVKLGIKKIKNTSHGAAAGPSVVREPMRVCVYTIRHHVNARTYPSYQSEPWRLFAWLCYQSARQT